MTIHEAAQSFIDLFCEHDWFRDVGYDPAAEVLYIYVDGLSLNFSDWKGFPVVMKRVADDTQDLADAIAEICSGDLPEEKPKTWHDLPSML